MSESGGMQSGQLGAQFAQQPHQQPCPSCGYCPTCGRRAWGTYPVYPNYPWYYTTTGGGITGNLGATVFNTPCR